MPKLLSGYAGPAFPAGHLFAGDRYAILNNPAGNGPFDFNADPGSQSHRVTFCIPWEGAGAFQAYCLMGQQSTTSGGTTTITRTLPMLSPFAAQFPNTYAVRVSGKGDGTDADMSESRPFSDCLVSVEFSTLKWNPEGATPFLEVNYAGSTSYITMSGASLAFSNGERIDHDAGVLAGQEAIQVTIHQVPDVGALLGTLRPLKGKINSAALVVDGITYPARSILFNTYQLRKSVDSGGNPTATATVELLQRDIPWDSGLRSDGVVDTITPLSYATADLSTIFTG